MSHPRATSFPDCRLGLIVLSVFSLERLPPWGYVVYWFFCEDLRCVINVQRLRDLSTGVNGETFLQPFTSLYFS